MTDSRGPGQDGKRKLRGADEEPIGGLAGSVPRWESGGPKPAVRSPSSMPARKMPSTRPGSPARVQAPSTPAPATSTRKGVLDRPAVRRPNQSTPVTRPETATKPKTQPVQSAGNQGKKLVRKKRDMQSVAQALAEDHDAREEAESRSAWARKGVVAGVVRYRLVASILLIATAAFYAFIPVAQEAARRADEAYLADVIEDEAKRIGRAAGKANLAAWIQARELTILRNFYRTQSEKLVAAVKKQGFEDATSANVGLRVDFDARILVVSAQIGAGDGRMISAASTTSGKRAGHAIKETGLGPVFSEQGSVIGGIFTLAAVLIVPMYLIPIFARRREPPPVPEVISSTALDEAPPMDS